MRPTYVTPKVSIPKALQRYDLAFIMEGLFRSARGAAWRAADDAERAALPAKLDKRQALILALGAAVESLTEAMAEAYRIDVPADLPGLAEPAPERPVPRAEPKAEDEGADGR